MDGLGWGGAGLAVKQCCTLYPFLIYTPTWAKLIVPDDFFAKNCVSIFFGGLTGVGQCRVGCQVVYTLRSICDCLISLPKTMFQYFRWSDWGGAKQGLLSSRVALSLSNSYPKLMQDNFFAKNCVLTF